MHFDEISELLMHFGELLTKSGDFEGPMGGLGRPGAPEAAGDDFGEGFTGQVAESDGRVVKYRRLGILPRIQLIPRIPYFPADPAEVVAAGVPQTLPSTRAGGQDDVS